jgi:hypothetical protein
LVLPGGIITIGERAFEGCSGLVRLVFPETVEIGWSALRNCTSLACLTFPAQIRGPPDLGLQSLLLELELVGSVLAPAVFERLVETVTLSTRVIGAELVGRSFGTFPIYAT